MKIALITDTHFGARSDSVQFDNFFRKFYDEVFFPYLVNNDISTIVHLGDVFDRRKFINYTTLHNCRQYYFEQIKKLGLQLYQIVGNHDTYFKNTNEVNSLGLIAADYAVDTIVSEPKEIIFDGCSVLMVPWLCADNYVAASAVIEKSCAPVCFGHFELAGFQMYKGMVNEHGMKPGVFDKFDLVCSGHFHHRSTKGNITYLGNPYEITWSDYDDPRGFHVFDTDTLDLAFVENPNTIFIKYYYDDKLHDPDAFDTSLFNQRYVKVIVINKTDFYKFDRFIDRIYIAAPLELKIIEDFSEFEADALEDTTVDIEDTMSLLSDFVDVIETDMDRPKIKSMLKKLYIEAQQAGDAA